MATKTVRRKTSPITARFLQFLVFQADEVAAKREKEKIKKELVEFTEKHHEVDEEKGHQIHTLPEPITVAGKTFTGFMRQRKVSQVFLEDKAQELCESKGFDIEDYTERVIDQDKIVRLYADDKITEEEFNSLIEESESYAFVPVKE